MELIMTTRYQTHYSVSIACDANAFPEPTNFGTDGKAAQRHADTLVKMLTLSAEPLPAVPGHGPDWTTYTVSSVVPHETFGDWKVIILAEDVPDGEQCDTCGEWFDDEDAWGEHNDLAHY